MAGLLVGAGMVLERYDDACAFRAQSPSLPRARSPQHSKHSLKSEALALLSMDPSQRPLLGAHNDAARRLLAPRAAVFRQGALG